MSRVVVDYYFIAIIIDVDGKIKILLILKVSVSVSSLVVLYYSLYYVTREAYAIKVRATITYYVHLYIF